MEWTTPGLSRMEIVPRCEEASAARRWAQVASGWWNRLRAFGQAARVRAGRKRKTLSVRETAALGDRRFVSVIQFEGKRFLIGSGPSAITLLARLPDAVKDAVVTSVEP